MPIRVVCRGELVDCLDNLVLCRGELVESCGELVEPQYYNIFAVRFRIFKL